MCQQPTPGVEYYKMSTPKRLFQKGSFYHIYNRGNRKDEIFLDDRDYLRFLEKIKFYKDKCEVTILCYCLMPNHFHFLVKQSGEVSLSKFMLVLITSYSKYFNLKYKQVGRVFQDRFQAKLVSTDEYLLQLSRYVHLNPSGITKKFESYRWSSLKYYIDLKENDEIVDSKIILNYFFHNNPEEDYKSFVFGGLKQRIDTEIKNLAMDL